MNITGIIAEFNPLHKGHIRLIDHAKKELDSAFVIVAMSGNYMQRGIPAMIDKYTRATHAVAHGADLVIELPVTGATQSAEGYARTGVLTLHATGLVNRLLFGSEHPNIAYFKEAADLADNDSMDFYKRINELVRTGMNYAAARELAMQERGSHQFPSDFLSGSNNILGIEYVKAINAYHVPMEPFTFGREGGSYNSFELNASGISSATAIRHAIHVGNAEETIDSLPADVVKDLRSAITNNEIDRTDDASAILHYALLKEHSFDRYADITEDLSNKIENNKSAFITFKGFADLLKSKDLTYTRISRCLMHILLGITDTDTNDLKTLSYAPYLHILGFNKRGTFLLKQMKESARTPFFASVNEVAGMTDMADPLRQRQLSRDLFADNIYRLLLTERTKKAHPTPFTFHISPLP